MGFMDDLFDMALTGMDLAEERIDSLLDPPDYSTPARKRRLVEEAFSKYENKDGYARRPYYAANRGRRRKEVLKAVDEAAGRFGSMGLRSVEESLAGFEASCGTSYEILDDINCFSLAAAIWILDRLRLSNRLHDAFDFLPGSSEEIWDVWIPVDFYHPCYEQELIQSVVYMIAPENREKGQTENYRKLLGLLDPETVQAAADKFRSLQWDTIRAFLKSEKYFDREMQAAALEWKKLHSTNVLIVDHTAIERQKNDLLKKYMDLVDDRRSFNQHFDFVLGSSVKKFFGIRELGKALEVEIGDPFELCFGLSYLLCTDDDSIWLMRAGTAAGRAITKRLPWCGFSQNLERDDWDLEDDELTFNGNGWLDREPISEKVDLYSIPKNQEDNISQRIYQLSRGIVPAGMHPFAAEHEEMKKAGVENADFIADWSEILFLASFQVSAVNLRRNDWLWNPDDTTGLAGAYSEDTKFTDVDPATSPDAETDPDIDTEEALSKARDELENARRQIKNLRQALSEAHRDADAERAKTERELKTLRMEHRELADLRELVFNRENKVHEAPAKEISYPYETRKRTVVFGGHDTFLKAIRPLLPTVKFVDTQIYSFNPEIVRNADVVWIQNNCISHSQYGNIVKITRQYGIQLRYFAYASAEKCAEQLVTEDQKDG